MVRAEEGDDRLSRRLWRQQLAPITTASAKEEAQKCPSITGYEYADGQGNTQKAISDIKSMAAKGTDALVVFGDAGPAVLPALTSVFKAGKVVVPYRVEVGGEAGKNYTQFIGASFKNDGVNWGNWIKSILPNGGNLLFLSGPAGNSQGTDELAGLKSVLGPEYKFINSAPFDVTNWDPALTQQVLTAEIAKNPHLGDPGSYLLSLRMDGNNRRHSCRCLRGLLDWTWPDCRNKANRRRRCSIIPLLWLGCWQASIAYGVALLGFILPAEI